MDRQTPRFDAPFLLRGDQESATTPTRELLRYLLEGWQAQETELRKLAAQEEREERRQFSRGMLHGLKHAGEDLDAALTGHVFPGFGQAPRVRIWLLRRVAREGGPDEPRLQVEGVALSEQDAQLWKAESGEYDHQTEEVPVWHPAIMMVSGDVDLDDPETAEAMEDIRQAAGKRIRERQ